MKHFVQGFRLHWGKKAKTAARHFENSRPLRPPFHSATCNRRKNNIFVTTLEASESFLLCKKPGTRERDHANENGWGRNASWVIEKLLKLTEMSQNKAISERTVIYSLNEEFQEVFDSFINILYFSCMLHYCSYVLCYWSDLKHLEIF